jgi:hypothetical protein
MQLRRLFRIRTLGVACALAALALPLTACGDGSAAASANEAKNQQEATLYEIDQVEKTFHKAGSERNVNLMMSLWAPGATFNIGTSTYTGKAAIRRFFATQNPAFQPQNHWESDTPSYKIRITVNGSKATLYFECHYVDVKTGKVAAVVGVDHNLQKINGKWLIVSGSGAAATLG